jgi:hypothetical protein
MDESRGDHRGRLPAGACEINGPNRKIKILNEGGASRGSIGRKCETDRNPSVYPVRLRRIERLSGPVLRRYGLPVRRHERSEVTTTQGFSLVFTARPHMSFTVWLTGFFFTPGLAYLLQKILGTGYWRSWRSLSSGRWFWGTCFDEY